MNKETLAVNEIKLSNKNGIPISTVGELKEVLIPFMDECPINDISVFYVGSSTDGAKLSIKPCNTHMHMDSNKVSSDCVCKKCGRGPYINSGFADSCCQ